MTEFSASAQLEIQLDSGSLRSAKKELEQELTADPIQVEVETSRASRPGSASRGLSDTSSDASGGKRPGKILQDQGKTLGVIESHWRKNLELNEERNELLWQLLDETEKGNQSRLGRLGRIGGGGGGGGLLALGLGAAAVGSVLDFDLPNLELDVPELPDLPPLEAPDIPPLSAPDIDPLEVPNIDPLEVPNIDPLEVPNIDPLEVPNIDPLEVPEIPPLEIPGIPQPEWMWPEIPQPDWIPIPPPEMPEMPGSPSPTPAPHDVPTPSPSIPDVDGPEIGTPDVPIEVILGGAGGAAAGGAAWLKSQGARGGSALGRIGAGRAVGVSTPVFTPSMFNEDLEGFEGTILDESHFIRQAVDGKGAGGGQTWGDPLPGRNDPATAMEDSTGMIPDSHHEPIDLDGLSSNNSDLDLEELSSGRSSRGSSRSQSVTATIGAEDLPAPDIDVNVNPNINLDGDKIRRDLEDQVDRAVEEAKSETMKKIGDLERALSRRR
ncbi:hypothetical protein ACYJ1Y_16045 [Natrialbaceae archaeon A-gly3]